MSSEKMSLKLTNRCNGFPDRSCRIIACIGLLWWCTATVTAAPPPGYSSEATILLAFAAGQIDLVDRDPPIPDSIVVKRDIQYGKVGEDDLLLDLYSPRDLDSPAPGLVFIHGGGWKGGKRQDYQSYGVRFAEKGYVVASISYRLRDVAKYPAAVEDAKCAIRWMRKNASGNRVLPNKIAAAGGSAGGHLSMMVGYTSDEPTLEGTGGHPDVSSRVQAVVNLYGPTDLTTPYGRSHPLVTSFIGASYDDAADIYKQASPLTHVTADDPPTLTLHGTIDSLVPVRQADRLVEKLKQCRVDAPYERLEGWPHAMDAAQVVNDYCFDAMLKFFDQHLKTTP